MTELIELILAKPLEFLAGFGISATTIFSIWKLLAWIISLFTKGKRLRKEKETQTAIAAAVINAFGGLDKFINKVAERVIFSISESEFARILKNQLEQIKESTNCPVELQAYIETVLTQDGSEDLKVIYEQIKNNLLFQVQNKTNQIIKVDDVVLEEVDDVVLEENDELNKQNIQEQKQNIHTLEHIDSNTENKEGDVDYA